MPINNKNLIYYILFASMILKLILLNVVGVYPLSDGFWYMDTATKIYHNNFIYPNDELGDAPATSYFYAIFCPFANYFARHIDASSFFVFGNILLATATIFILYKISLLIFKNEKIANITALITLIYPFFNFYSLAILTETLYLFFLYLSLFFAIKFYESMNLKDVAFFSLFFALDTLVRFANLSMFIFFVILFIIFALKKNQNFIFLTKVIIVAISSFVLIMSLWWVRNYNVFGEFVATSVGESGKVFYSGNNPLNKSGGGIVGVDADLSQFEHIKDDKARDEAMWETGINWIKENPSDWLILEFAKLKRFFSFTFYATEFQGWYYNLISIMSYGVIFILFLYGVFKFSNYFWLYSPMVLYFILLTGVHLVFIASIRYRLPLEPFMIIIASAVIYNFIKEKIENN